MKVIKSVTLMFHALRQSSDYITIITTPFGVSTHECTWQKIGQVAIEMIKFSRKPKQLKGGLTFYRNFRGTIASCCTDI